MSKEEYLEMLYQKLNIPKQLLIKYIHLVGTNEENIKDYAMNASCAVVRKDNGFQIDYTAKMINNKDQKINQLKQQLEELKEKDKEIERLKNLFKLNNEVVINQGKEIFDLRVQVLQQKQNQTQLAIQELEKVKTLIQNAINFEKPNFVEVYDAINKQINDLKGEKDE